MEGFGYYLFLGFFSSFTFVLVAVWLVSVGAVAASTLINQLFGIFIVV